jgi:endonuclease-3
MAVEAVESAAARKRRAGQILARLREEYPDSRCALDFASPLQLLAATVLAAQCTDARVNAVTPELFARYPTARHLAEAELADLEEVVHPTGFYRNKARALQGLGRALVAEHGGEVPDDMEALRALPGVGRKTANVVIGNAFHRNEGIVVDTHVTRLSRRLGLTAETHSETAEKIERDLMPLVPREDWTLVSHLLIDHGRAVCKAKKPECPRCVLQALCPSAEI